ncbi:MAG: hypothetical protein ACRERC_15080, partial [Candidatus Binatia bacterium]
RRAGATRIAVRSTSLVALVSSSALRRGALEIFISPVVEPISGLWMGSSSGREHGLGAAAADA